MKEHFEEMMEYVKNHDLDEEEYYALESWVSKGNSPYTNPDHYCNSYGEEVSYMKWYWILEDPRHPEHRSLMKHRHRLEDETADLYENSRLPEKMAKEFLAMDYSNSTLNPGQDWYIGGSSFLSLDETKEHLLIEMEYIKSAFQSLLDLKDAVECQLSEMDLTGNLFEDVLNVGELLAEVEIYAEYFMSAYSDINGYEDWYRDRYFSRKEKYDLPF